MIFPLFRRNRRPDTISTLYGMIVAQARMPCFYRDYAVPDTVNGRFDLIVLHLALVLDRLMRDPGQREAGQGLFDHFCADMDDNLREIGISDLKVPKEMRRMGEAFYGRAQAYQAALAAKGDEELIETVARNVYGAPPPGPAAAVRLAAYMREAVREVAAQDAAAVAQGALRLPDPAAIPAVAD
ncbi:MAG TPA: ubiquinol-cytochrome C chaperone family protein [Pseudolabrys sp.]|jgi:cytochrome b pre-mRNA-processing protein 3